MMVSGVHISYGIFNINLNTTVNLAIVQSSWYVGVILAGFAAHFFIDKWEKKIFYVSLIFFLYFIIDINNNLSV